MGNMNVALLDYICVRSGPTSTCTRQFSRARHAAIPSVHIFRDWRVAREGNEFAFNVALIMSLAAESAHV